MLPARQGDAIWVEYGTSGASRRILIDAGPIDAFPDVEAKLKTLKGGDKRVELVVITHVDTDHIEGMIRLFAERRQKWLIAPEDIWFNGYRHMNESGVLGGREGDFLSALLRQRLFENWNKKFEHKPVVIDDHAPLSPFELRDGVGMKLTLLSPTRSKLEIMAAKWEKDVSKHGIKPGDLEAAWQQLLNQTKYHPADGILGGPGELDVSLRKQLKADQSAANGSSIAFLAEFGGKSCLFLGDAHSTVIVKSIKRLLPKGKKRLTVDAVKVSHHGSRSNISQALMDVIDAKFYLISTNGAKYNHPNDLAIKAIIQGSIRDPVICFNYETEQTLRWKKFPEPGIRTYTAHYPNNLAAGYKLELLKIEETTNQ